VQIIAGTHKGRIIDVPKYSVRPTMDRVRESLFAIIRDEIEGADVLDLFAGSGSLGLEALSEGATWCDFVEKSFKVGKVLQKNIQSLGFDDVTCIHLSSAMSYLKNCKKVYDLIFFDPPYKQEVAEKVIEAIYINRILNDDGLIIAETRKREDITRFSEYIVKEKIYGETKITILRKGAA